jgi:hypothetical protein
MKTSESISKIAAALLAAQQSMTTAKKGAKNPYLGNNYADLASVDAAARPALNAAGVVYVQSAGGDDKSAVITTRFIHAESGEWIEDSLTIAAVPAVVDKKTGEKAVTPQALGSALSYARRYSLAAMACVLTSDDDGEAAMSRSAYSAPAAKTGADALPEAEALGVKIDAAQTTQALEALLPVIRATPKAVQDAVRAVYARRSDELKRGAA